MKQDHTAYCWDFNEQGYCKTCGATRTAADEPRITFHLNGQWPTNTWFRRRRLELALKASLEAAK